jgi:hypothetical protein
MHITPCNALQKIFEIFCKQGLTVSHFTFTMRVFPATCGAIAQLGERLHGMQEVGGSIPPGSTKNAVYNLSFRFCPHRLEA